jgi:hypothetical protein
MLSSLACPSSPPATGLSPTRCQAAGHPSDRRIDRAQQMLRPGVRDDGVRLMSRWEVLKIILLALAVSVVLTAAGALIAIGIAHL